MYQPKSLLAVIVRQLAVFKRAALDAFYYALFGADGVASAHEAQCIQHAKLFFSKRKMNRGVEQADHPPADDVAVVESRASVAPPFHVCPASNPCRRDR